MVEAIGGAIGGGISAGIRVGGVAVGTAGRTAVSSGAEIAQGGPNLLRGLGALTARIPEQGVRILGKAGEPIIRGEANTFGKIPATADGSEMQLAKLRAEVQAFIGTPDPEPQKIIVIEPKADDPENLGILGVILSLIGKVFKLALDTGQEGLETVEDLVNDPKVRNLIAKQLVG